MNRHITEETTNEGAAQLLACWLKYLRFLFCIFSPQIFFCVCVDFLNSRDDSLGPDAACCWWCCRDQQNLLSKTPWGLLLQTGIKPPGLHDPQQWHHHQSGGLDLTGQSLRGNIAGGTISHTEQFHLVWAEAWSAGLLQYSGSVRLPTNMLPSVSHNASVLPVWV